MSYPKCPECGNELQCLDGISYDSLPPQKLLTCQGCKADFHYTSDWYNRDGTYDPEKLNKIKSIVSAKIDVEEMGFKAELKLITQPPPIYSCRIISGPEE